MIPTRHGRNTAAYRCLALLLALAACSGARGMAAGAPDHEAAPVPARRSQHSTGYRRMMGLPRPPIRLRVPKVGREVERRQLKNGMILYLMEDHERPMVRISAAIRTGSQFVSRDQEVAMGLLGGQIRQGGTKSRTFDQINDELEFLGASIESSTGGEQSGASLDVLTKDLDTGLKLFADVLMNPAFDARQLEIAKGLMIEGIRRRNDEPSSILSRYFTRLLYTPEHPLGRGGFTTIAQVSAVTSDQLAVLHRRYYGPNNVWMAVVGDFNRPAMVAKIEGAFAGWAPVDAGEIAKEKAHLPRASGKNIPGVFVIQRPLNQASIAIGHFGVERTNPDRYAIDLMNELLGGGDFTSRIVERVRSDEGLAYSVGTSFPTTGRDLGLFEAGLETKTESTAPAIRAVIEEIARVRKEPVSSQELELVKEEMINSYLFRFSSRLTVVTRLMQLELDGLPSNYYETLLDRYRAVTPKEIQRVAQKYLHPDQLTIFVVGDTKSTRAALGKLGKVTEVPLEAEAGG